MYLRVSGDGRERGYSQQHPATRSLPEWIPPVFRCEEKGVNATQNLFALLVKGGLMMVPLLPDFDTS
jgi:hypothetical protein